MRWSGRCIDAEMIAGTVDESAAELLVKPARTLREPPRPYARI